MEEPRGLSELNDQDRELALERYHLLHPYLENRVPLSTLAQSYDLPLRTARRWVSAYHTSPRPPLHILAVSVAE